jgi:hypothetical protein
MEYCHKIDKSLTERHTIVNLLESLKREDITMEEMEKIGARLQKAGKRALFPLIRRLWREENGDHISRYVYLLDFFEDEVWIDQIIRIALKRNDLEEDGKAALLSVLEDYGIDISAPPFSKVLAELNGPLELSLPKLFDKGEVGMVRFMEDFLCYPRETQAAVIGRIAGIKDQRVILLLEILLRFDDREIVGETISTLGRIRDSKAASLLKAFDCQGDAGLRRLAERSLRRLSFVGVMPDEPAADASPLPMYVCSVSSIDGSGNRTLWFSRWGTEGRVDVLFMQLHEKGGMVDALGYSDISREKYDKLYQEVSGEDALTEIEPVYAILLIRDALSLNKKNSSHLPAEFYVQRGILPAEALVPGSYTPRFPGFDLGRLGDCRELVEQSASLFEEEYFDGWFTADGRTFDLAEKFDLLESRSAGRRLATALEGFVEGFIQEKVVPHSDRMARRLFLIADLMRRTGRERTLVEKTLAVALDLLNPGFPERRNPFLRQYALESLKITREAIAEGFDLRLHGDWDEDGELWD